MNTHLDFELVRVRLQEAREWAAQEALAASLDGPRQPVRVTLGLGLVKLGRWLAADADQPDGAPSRAAA